MEKVPCGRQTTLRLPTTSRAGSIADQNKVLKRPLAMDSQIRGGL